MAVLKMRYMTAPDPKTGERQPVNVDRLSDPAPTDGAVLSGRTYAGDPLTHEPVPDNVVETTTRPRRSPGRPRKAK